MNHATVLVACQEVDELLARDADVHWEGPHGNKVAKARTILAQLEDSVVR